MIKIDEIKEIVSKYDKDNIHIGLIGSHSALEMAYGAKLEGMKTVVICQKGREKTYAKYFRNLFDEVIILDKFSDMVKDEVQDKLRELNTIFVPSRSFSVYVGYDNIENKFYVPIHGNRFLLKIEERNLPRNQYYLLEKAGINMPKIFKNPEEIDRLVIVKVPEKKRKIERAFFFATSYEDFKRKAEERIKRGIIDENDLKNATIEEYILGAKFNANFYYSVLNDEIELLGFDRRIQTNIDGFLDLPARDQLEIDVSIQNVEIGHYAVTLRESQIEKVFEAAEKFVEITKKEYPPGIIGLFALQGAFTVDLKFYVFDVSPRIPGSPCLDAGSPYHRWKHLKEMPPGRRVAVEIKEAIKRNRLEDIVT